MWFRKLAPFVWFCDYFPITIHKMAELDPRKTYIFGYHPHGIISMGAFATFATEGNGFSQKFPGIVPHLLTLDINFRIPFYALYLGLLGVCSAGKENCMYILNQLGAGNSITLVLGGAKESLDAHPGRFDLTLRNRKGFVKVAMRSGASLVPVFGFGENDLFDQVENARGSRLRRAQNFLQSRLGFAFPLLKGLFPRKIPIRVVFGAPIDVPKLNEDEITTEKINKIHAAYLAGLDKVYQMYKARYARDRRSSLVFVQ